VTTETPSMIQAFLDTLRPEIKDLPRYNAGLSVDYVRSRYGVTEIAKLGSNENPYGASPAVRQAVADAASEIAIYPEASCDPLRRVVAEWLGVAQDRLLFGNGSEDIIAIASHTFLAPGARVVTFAPSFGLHVIWPQSAGAQVETVPVKADYAMDVDEILAALTPDTRMLIFGNPSSPVGTSLSAGDMRSILRHLSPQTLLVFDEAYLEYASADPGYPDFFALLSQSQSPWLILRTLSKAYGLAGLRVGYAIASDPQLIDLMDRVRAPFNVNRLAQIAAIAAFSDRPYIDDVVQRTVVERERMRHELAQLGYRIAPSLANFLFVQVREGASELALKLLTRGVIVKPWREPGFRDHIRVSIGLPAANDQFLNALKSVAR
jgi:histidinol-phosphate aminotransferase